MNGVKYKNGVYASSRFFDLYRDNQYWDGGELWSTQIKKQPTSGQRTDQLFTLGSAAPQTSKLKIKLAPSLNTETLSAVTMLSLQRAYL